MRPERLHPTEEGFQRIAAVLDQGGVIAFPTDTVFGIAARLDRPAALRRIYQAKGRDLSKPLPVLLADAGQVLRFASSVSEAAKRLMDRFFPGPLTLILPATPDVPELVTAGTGTVGLRCPDHPLALHVLRDGGGALATTSANRSGGSPAQTADEALSALGDQIDAVLDGDCGRQTASTLVDMTVDPPRLLRQGPIGLETLRAVVPRLESA